MRQSRINVTLYFTLLTGLSARIKAQKSQSRPREFGVDGPFMSPLGGLFLSPGTGPTPTKNT
jgi:hypothetical protein